MMKDVDRIRATREAGNVMRCHTLRPYVGDYTVASHSWNAATLLYLLHPTASRNLLLAVLFHDVAERFVGDQPSTVRQINPELRLAQDEAELDILRKLRLDFVLTVDETDWLKIVDKLELLLWCMDQRWGLGNQSVTNALHSLTQWFEEQIERGNLPASVVRFFHSYEWRRSSELL